MKFAPTLVSSAVLIGTASAASIVQTKSYAFLPDGSQNLSFNKFDTTLGTLTSVTVAVNLNKTGGRFEVDNDSETAGTITLNHNVIGSLSVVSGDVGLIRSNFTQIGASGTLTASNSLVDQAVSATTGDATNTFNATGLGDYVLFTPANSSVSDSGTIASFAQSTYEGTGTYVLRMNANQSVNATGFGGLQQAFTVSNVLGDVTVVYNYDAVPEPTSAAIGGLGLLAILRRRRR
jgi:hypothetical protein